MSKKTPMTPLFKVLNHGGAYRNIARSTDPKPARWAMPTTVTNPWDPVQARLNRVLYPHLFTGK